VKLERNDSGLDTTHGTKIALRGGYIHQTTAGVYTLSPLGLRVQRKIEQIVRTEMDAVDGQEIRMPVVSGADLWRESGRYDNMDNLQKFKGRNGVDYVLNPTHEEVVVDYTRAVLETYRQLPFMVYQIQTKYRDELRTRAGLIRTREFTMKDGYSFHETQGDLENYYHRVFGAYERIFARVGLRGVFATESDNGDMGGNFSQEFQWLSPIGEDTVYFCDACKYSANKEVAENGICPKCGAQMRAERGVEVGNIFQLSTKYSVAMGLKFTTADGAQQHPIMGCYGIGIGRTLACLIEQDADENGPKWNMAVAPFAVAVIGIPDKSGDSLRLANRVYDELIAAGIDVILDDRDARAGEKFADADLIAAPVQLIVSEKNTANGIVEVKYRTPIDTTGLPDSVKIDDAAAGVKKIVELLQ
jgi:prolyl-tRNA synthetase